MVVIHRIFRRGFPSLADLVRRIPAHDTAWAGAVAAHAEFLLNGLHHHHTAEDELLWPRLLERTQPDALLVARMEDQHAVVAPHVARIRHLLPGWRAAPSRPPARSWPPDSTNSASPSRSTWTRRKRRSSR
jgi:iron-sulfur cluster repair protein YtfE (RIC family)